MDAHTIITESDYKNMHLKIITESDYDNMQLKIKQTEELLEKMKLELKSTAIAKELKFRQEKVDALEYFKMMKYVKEMPETEIHLFKDTIMSFTSEESISIDIGRGIMDSKPDCYQRYMFKFDVLNVTIIMNEFERPKIFINLTPGNLPRYEESKSSFVHEFISIPRHLLRGLAATEKQLQIVNLFHDENLNKGLAFIRECKDMGGKYLEGNTVLENYVCKRLAQIPEDEYYS